VIREESKIVTLIRSRHFNLNLVILLKQETWRSLPISLQFKGSCINYALYSIKLKNKELTKQAGLYILNLNCDTL